METTDQHDRIDRREAIWRVGVLMGGVAFVGGSVLLSACERRGAEPGGATGAGSLFSPDEVAMLDEIADTILPATNTPGAKAAKTGAFMAVMVTDCYETADQRIFRDGLLQVDSRCRQANSTSFLQASPAQRLVLLEKLDLESKAYMDVKKATDPTHYFRMMKELTLLGYFTSEIGCTQAQRYVESPGRFDPCVPYAAGETSWAGHA